MTSDQHRTVIDWAFGAVTVAPATNLGRRLDSTRVSFGKAPGS
jgi:hypothetical protein